MDSIISNLPASQEEVYVWQFMGVVVFTLATFLLQFQRGDRFDFHTLSRNMLSGATFPVYFLLSVTPIKPSLIVLFSSAPIYFMLSGFLGMAVTLYSLLKKSSKGSLYGIKIQSSGDFESAKS
jgi:hypothetical protein